MNRRMTCHGAFLAAVLATLVLPAVAADKTKSREPGPKSKGAVFEWQSKDGLVYRYRIPQRYDPETGCNLTLILHGSNLDRRWGFANHSYKSFRPDDLVVSPDGTTPNGRGGFNFLKGRKDTKRLHALQQELQKALRIRRTYIYGHSQGSFFAFLYAGEFPEDVHGVVGHASGVWAGTRQGKKQHHQAIVLMHGTQDPVVPYRQSAASYVGFLEAKYPMVRVRSLEGWNHWPAEQNSKIPHTSQQLAWCEGMTTDDARRMDACFDFIASCKIKERTDYAAVYTLAKHITESSIASGALKKRAARAMEAVDELAAAHVAALRMPDKPKFGKKAWVVHAPMFLRTFAQVPACEAFREKHAELLEKQREDADRHLARYYQSSKESDSFEAGVAAVAAGYLYVRCQDNQLLDNLDKWAKDARKLRLSKKALKTYEAFVAPLRKLVKEGNRAFDAVNRKSKKL